MSMPSFTSISIPTPANVPEMLSAKAFASLNRITLAYVITLTIANGFLTARNEYADICVFHRVARFTGYDASRRPRFHLFVQKTIVL